MSIQPSLLRLATPVDRLLRSAHQPVVASPAFRAHSLPWLVGCIVICGLFYGAAMGTFGGVGDDRWLQVVYSALKLPMLLGIAFVVAVPSFFVINTLMGLRDDFLPAIRALMEAQAVLSIVLASLAPYTLFWYASCRDYPTALLFNGLMMAIASATAQGMLRRQYRRLVALNPRHRWMLRIWLGLYVFIAIQMAWVLRPFVGQPDLPVTFFRADAWGNAYGVVFNLVWSAVRKTWIP